MKKIIVLLLLSLSFALTAAPYTLVEVTDDYAVFIENYEGITIPVDTLFAIHQPGTTEPDDSTFVTYVTVIDVQGDQVYVQKINTASPILLSEGMVAIPGNKSLMPPDEPVVVEDPADTEDNGGFEDFVDDEGSDDEDSEYVREVDVNQDVTDFLMMGVQLSLPFDTQNSDSIINPANDIIVRGSIGLKTGSTSFHLIGGVQVIDTITIGTTGLSGYYHLGPLYIGGGAELMYWNGIELDILNLFGEMGVLFQIANTTYVGASLQANYITQTTIMRPAASVSAGILF